INNEFHKRNNRRYQCPAKQEINNTPTNAPQIKFVDAEPAEKKSQQGRCNFALLTSHGFLPDTTFGAYFCARINWLTASETKDGRCECSIFHVYPSFLRKLLLSVQKVWCEVLMRLKPITALSASANSRNIRTMCVD